MIQKVIDQNFDQVLAEARLPVLVEFWKPGCGSCRALKHELELLEGELIGQFLILSMNVEENYQIPAELEIHSLPVLALYHQGIFTRFIGGLGTRAAILKELQLP